MAKYPGLLRDKRRHWTVRVRVPEQLQEIVARLVDEQAGHKQQKTSKLGTGRPTRRRELWRSTGTSDHGDAKRLYPIIRADLDALLLEAKRQWQPLRKVSEAELHQLVRVWFFGLNKAADRTFTPPQTDGERDELLESLDEDEASTAATIEEPSLQEVADRFIKQHRIAIERGSRDWFRLVKLVQGVSLELTRRERARLNGAIVDQHFEPFFAGITPSSPPPTPPPKAVTFTDLFDAWAKERRFAKKTRYSWEKMT